MYTNGINCKVVNFKQEFGRTLLICFVSIVLRNYLHTYIRFNNAVQKF